MAGSLDIVLFVDGVSQPDGVAHPIHFVECQKRGWLVGLLYAIENGTHSGAAIDTTTYHEAYLIEKSGLKKRAVDMSSTDNPEPFNSEFIGKNLHRPWQVYAILSTGDP